MSRTTRRPPRKPRRVSNRQQTDANAARTIFGRTMLLLAIFGVLVFIPLAWKLYQLQIVKAETLEMRATNQQTKDVTVSASRGSIYDTSGKTLAVSATVYNVIISPKDIHNITEDDLKAAYGDKYKSSMTDAQIEAAEEELVEERIELIASNLSAILDVDESEIIERCAKEDSMYAVVKKKVEAEVEEQVQNLIDRYDLGSCIYMETDSKRYYPYSTLAAQIVGFVNNDNDGAYGLELMYQDTLAGVEGRKVTAKNSVGTDLLYYYSDYYGAEDGSSIYLTIDSTIQYYCEQILQEGIEKYNVQNGGWAIAMNPNTGEILGIASAPTYDLNDPSAITDEVLLQRLEDKQAELDEQVAEGTITQEEADEQYNEEEANCRYTQWADRAINTNYEPGSTFKSIVLASALEEGVIDTNSSFYCSGSVELDTWTIRCSARSGHGSLMLNEAVGKSCNMAFISIGQALGADKFWDYLEAFGITKKTGVDLPGESNSNLWSESEFTGSGGYVDLAVASFGQRFTVTPIQLITAVSATINGGYLYEPHVLKQIEDADGNIVESVEPTVVRQVISEETSATVRELLEGVVRDYTGKNAYQAGYRIGGKTGTAQTTRTDDEGEYIVSFVGFAPANDPQIVVLLALDWPSTVKNGSSWSGDQGYSVSGGAMACPLAGELIAEICDYLGVEKQYTDDEASLADATTPSVIGMTEEQLATTLEEANLTYEVVGTGTTCTAQTPASGTILSNSSKVVVYMGEEASRETVAVPDVTGMSAYEARHALENVGLYYRATGVSTSYTAEADGQSTPAGTEITVGTVVTVHFSDAAVENVA